MQGIRLISLTLLGIVLFTLPALGWLKLLDLCSDIYPTTALYTDQRPIRMIAVLWGLFFTLLPFYTLVYFHRSKSREVLGFKTPSY